MKISKDILITITGDKDSNSDIIAYMIYSLLSQKCKTNHELKLTRVSHERIKEIKEILVNEPIILSDNIVEVRSENSGRLYDI